MAYQQRGSVKLLPSGAIYERMLEVLRRHPEGISITDIRRELGLAAQEQQHLDRRLRTLDPYYVIRRVRSGRQLLYVLEGERPGAKPRGTISKSLRARIFHLAGYRCQMCGRTVAEDHIKLNPDHKVPEDWGGPTVEENLWALCSECNEGKKAFFASITDERVRHAIVHGSVHVRLGELLKAFAGQRVPKPYLQIVAYTHDDWEKRLRELRELGWRYHTERRKEQSRVRTYFILDRSESWPDDPAAAIREAEARKRTRRADG